MTYVCGSSHDCLLHVVYPVALQPQAVRLVRPLYQVLYALADEFVQLLKDHFRLLQVKRTVGELLIDNRTLQRMHAFIFKSCTTVGRSNEKYKSHRTAKLYCTWVSDLFRQRPHTVFRKDGGPPPLVASRLELWQRGVN